MINVLSENKVAFDAAPAPPLSSNSMRNKGWIEQWLSYVKNLGISVRLEVVKAIQTATVSLRVGGHIYITHKNSGAVICVPPDNDSVAASDPDIEEMWENVTAIDPSVDPRETLNKGNLSSKPQLVNFLNHCCRQRHYFLRSKSVEKVLAQFVSQCVSQMIFFMVSCTFLIQHLVVMDTINHLRKSLGKRLQKTIDHPFRRSRKKRRLFHFMVYYNTLRMRT